MILKGIDEQDRELFSYDVETRKWKSLYTIIYLEAWTVIGNNKEESRTVIAITSSPYDHIEPAWPTLFFPMSQYCSQLTIVSSFVVRKTFTEEQFSSTLGIPPARSPVLCNRLWHRCIISLSQGVWVQRCDRKERGTAVPVVIFIPRLKFVMKVVSKNLEWTFHRYVPQFQLLFDRYPNIGPLISRWELDKLKNCWNKSFRTSKILIILYQQFSNLFISQRDMSGPRLGALSNKRWSGDTSASRLKDILKSDLLDLHRAVISPHLNTYLLLLDSHSTELLFNGFGFGRPLRFGSFIIFWISILLTNSWGFHQQWLLHRHIKIFELFYTCIVYSWFQPNSTSSLAWYHLTVLY